MPITWDAQTEARLLAGIFKVCDIKVSGEQIKELAALIGPECTPKAITHRLAKFRSQAGGFNGGAKGKDSSTPKSTSPKKKKNASDTATPTKKRARATKKATQYADDDGSDSEIEVKKKSKQEDSDVDDKDGAFKNEDGVDDDF